jgi:hypothetical protein
MARFGLSKGLGKRVEVKLGAIRLKEKARTLINFYYVKSE